MALEQAINVKEGPTCSSTFSVVLHEEAVGTVHWDAMVEQDRGILLGDWWAGAFQLEACLNKNLATLGRTLQHGKKYTSSTSKEKRKVAENKILVLGKEAYAHCNGCKRFRKWAGFHQREGPCVYYRCTMVSKDKRSFDITREEKQQRRYAVCTACRVPVSAGTEITVPNRLPRGKNHPSTLAPLTDQQHCQLAVQASNKEQQGMNKVGLPLVVSSYVFH